MKRLGEPRFWNMEVIPIFGYRLDRWHLVANPGLDKAVSGASGTRELPARGEDCVPRFRQERFWDRVLTWTLDRCAIGSPATSRAGSCIVAWMANSETRTSMSDSDEHDGCVGPMGAQDDL